MFIEFEKWHGCKNDFVVTWVSDSDGDMLLDALRLHVINIFTRDGSGIGADGILALRVGRKTDLTPKELVIINQDGSIAANCGNGLRCATLSVISQHKLRGNPSEIPEFVDLQVGSRIFTCRLLPASSHSKNPIVAVEMERPRVDEDNPWYKDAHAFVKKTLEPENKKQKPDEVHFCSVGNNHAVISCENPDAETAMLWAPKLQSYSAWDGINVHLIGPSESPSPELARYAQMLGEPISEMFRAIPFERGVGLTQACGSGAVAIAAVQFASGMSERGSWLAIRMPGGPLFTKQDTVDGPVTLAGEAILSFRGSLEI